MNPMRRTLLVAMATLVWLWLAASPASAHSVAGVSATNFQHQPAVGRPRPCRASR